MSLGDQETKGEDKEFNQYQHLTLGAKKREEGRVKVEEVKKKDCSDGERLCQGPQSKVETASYQNHLLGLASQKKKLLQRRVK